MATTDNTVLVVTGGARLDEVAVRAASGAGRVVAADGGLDYALAAGIRPDVLVGDLDSISPAGLEWATANIAVERHPTDKAATDTELALSCAAATKPDRIVLLAGRGDRLDHGIAALGALGSDALEAVPAVEGWWGSDHVIVVRPGRAVELAEPPGTTFSLLALHGGCRGVTVNGTRWPLVDADLEPMSGLGVSNQVDEPPCRVEVAAGVLTVIIPGAQP